MATVFAFMLQGPPRGQRACLNAGEALIMSIHLYRISTAPHVELTPVANLNHDHQAVLSSKHRFRDTVVYLVQLQEGPLADALRQVPRECHEGPQLGYLSPSGAPSVADVEAGQTMKKDHKSQKLTCPTAASACAAANNSAGNRWASATCRDATASVHRCSRKLSVGMKPRSGRSWTARAASPLRRGRSSQPQP